MSHINKIDSVCSAKDWQLAMSCRELFVSSEEVRLRIFGSGRHRSLELVRLNNAQKRGAVCDRYYLNLEDKLEGIRGEQALCRLINLVDYDLAGLLDIIGSADFHKGDLTLFGFRVTHSELPAARVFSPFHLHRLKPLKAKPAKWTVRHVLRLVANKQYDRFDCIGRFTDDHKHDADLNYGKGPVKAPLPFIRDVIENPRGWVAHEGDDGRVEISCHSFHNNEVHPNLEACNVA